MVPADFKYPELPRKQILSFLVELEIASITEADLKRPKSEFVIDLYTKVLMYLGTLREEEHGQVEFAALEQLENPDLHVDSVRILNLCNKIRETLVAIECPEMFTLRDLLKPDGDRTERFVGAILNFCLYRDHKMEQLRPLDEELTMTDENRSMLDEQITEIKTEIEKYNEFKEKESPFVQELRSQIQELNQRISGLNSHQLSLKTTLLKMKEKIAELDEKISSAEFALVQTVQENANLRAKIVQSPDKLQKALEDKKLMLADVKNIERSAMQSVHEKKVVLEVYTKAGKKMSRHLDQMQAIQEQLTSSKSTEKDVKALRIKLDDERVFDKSLDAKVVEKQGKVEQLDASRKQLLREKDMKCGDANKKLTRLKTDIESRKQDLFARQKKVEAVVAEADAITSRTKTIKTYGASTQQELMFKAEQVVKMFNKYSSSVYSVLPNW